MGERFSTPLLDEAIAARVAAAEQGRQALLGRLLTVLPEAADRFDFRQLYLFGSVTVAGRFREDSDVDVAVVDLPGDQFFPLAAFLSSRLERDVDMVMLEDVHFAHKIKREGLLWTKSA